MKVLLVNPSLNRERIGHYKSSVEKTRGLYPSIGLLQIASVLEKEKHIVKIIDFDVEKNPQPIFLELLSSFKPDILGIHVMTWTFHQAELIAGQAKEIIPSLIIIVGGAGISSSPETAMKYSSFDYGIVGEGEETVSELINAVESSKDIDKIRGIVFRRQNKIIHNKSRPLIDKLDTLPIPARNLVPLDRYYDVFSRKSRFATMITSRGCPYNCTFCDRKNRMGTKWRTFSNRRIIKEMKELTEQYSVGEIMFFDDEFIIDRDKTMQLCKMISDEGLKVLWECRARADLVDRELLSAMRKAGCYRIRFGFESGDDDILKILKKGIKVEQSLKAAEMTKEAGIEIFGYFMMGVPLETEETLKKTLDLALETDPDFAIFSKAILIPGSEMFDWAVSEGLIKPDYWDRFLAGEIQNTAPVISTEILPGNEIDAFIQKSNRRFYFRPGYVAKRFSRIRSLSQLYRQAVMAYSLIFS